MKPILPILSICRKIRRKAEYYAKTSGRYSNDLHGMCAICSMALHTALQKSGVDSELIVGYYDNGNGDLDNDPCGGKPWINHAWVQIGETILDLTYSQFSDRKLNQEQLGRDSSYTPIKTVDYRHFRAWPKEQRPKQSIVRMLLA